MHISAEHDVRCNMNIKKLIGTSIITLFVVAMSVGMAAAAYTIDGDLTDWGVGVEEAGADWSLNATWLPNDDVRFQVEDNVDPKRDAETARWHGGTEAYATGVHIIGTGSNYVTYSEARVSSGSYYGWAFPTGSLKNVEIYDQEAMYVDDTYPTHLYFAIVLSCGGTHSGDLGLDITDTNANIVDKDGNFVRITPFEFGVKLSDGSGDLYDVSEWTECTDVSESSPARIKDGTKVGTATIAYVDKGAIETWLPDDCVNGRNTYIIEGEILRSDITGNPVGEVPFSKWHYTVLCGNDQIPIPEFGVIAVPIIALLGLVFFMRRKKS